MINHIKETRKITEQQLSESSRWVLFKHSTTCPISRGALAELELFSDAHPEVPVLYLEVQNQREVSNRIEEEFKIRHESPQAFIFKGDALRDHQSHGSITNGWLSHTVGGGFSKTLLEEKNAN